VRDTYLPRATGLPRRLWWYVALFTVSGILCASAAAISVATQPLGGWPAMAAVVVLMTGSRVAVLRLRLGSERTLFDWSEAALVVGLVLVGGPSLVLAALLGVTAAAVWQRLSLPKILFNVAAAVLSTALATWIAHTLGGPDLDPLTPVGAVAVVTAVAVSPLLHDLAVSAAIGQSQGQSTISVYRDGMSTRLLTLVGNVAVGFGAILLVGVNPVLLVLCPPVLWLLHQGYLGRFRAHSERRAWQQLAAATKSLNRLDESEVVDAAVAGAVALFSAEVVEVELVNGPASRRITRGNSQGDLWRGSPGGEVRAEPTVFSIALVDGGGAPIGELRLCFRGEVTLREREELALSAFADSLAAALRNAQTHHRLQVVADRTAYEATHDLLTGLMNRVRLLEVGRQLRGELAADQEGGSLSLLLLDFDHFKEVNDTLGHAAGDLLLTSAASRLAAEARPDERLARLGGDEFALLRPHRCEADSAAVLAEKRAVELLEALSEPVMVDGVALTVEASVGVAVTPVRGRPGGGAERRVQRPSELVAEGGPTPESCCDTAELLRRAEVAMYEAKGLARAISVYDVSRDAASLDRLALAAELRTALESEDQLFLHLQPSMDLASGSPVGAEALIRWRHPRRGLVPPGDFIPVVEHTDLLGPFTRYVLDKALTISAAWSAEGHPLPIAVNLSARSLLDRQLPGEVAALLGKHQVVPEQLVLEITETVMMSDLEVVEEVLEGLRRLGVQLSVDDFGTGYSSLTFLSRVSVDEVKIDRSFVGTMDTSLEAAAIVRTTIDLARTLGLRVVAEGVETAEQQHALSRLGCSAAQGFYLYPPMPVDKATLVIQSAVAADTEASVIELGSRRSARGRVEPRGS
jgi:diguanylate cyclase (GGDEF)-like protein